MYLKGILQQRVPVHSSTKRSWLPFSDNCIVQVAGVKVIAKRDYDLEQRTKTPDVSLCKLQLPAGSRFDTYPGQVGKIFLWIPTFFSLIFCNFLDFLFQVELFTLLSLLSQSFPMWSSAALISRKTLFSASSVPLPLVTTGCHLQSG